MRELSQAGEKRGMKLQRSLINSRWPASGNRTTGIWVVGAMLKRGRTSLLRISALVRARRENESNDVNNLRAIRVCRRSPSHALMHSPISGDCDTEDPGCCSMVAGAGCQKLQQEAQRDHSETTHVTNSRPGAESGFRLVRPGREPKGLAESTAQ